MIWARASPLRPRVIQLFYKNNGWHACEDGCGGLPPTRTVSREARKEALKGYTFAFDIWMDLEEDTIFISDPVFTIRKPQRDFLNTEYANRVRKVAMSGDVYDGLEQIATEFPTLCHRPMAILRQLEGLRHFILALPEDGEGDLYDDVSDDSEDGHVLADGDYLDHESGVEYNTVEVEPNHTDVTHFSGSAANNDVDQHEFQEIHRRLGFWENEALEDMAKGYVRHRGNIHFESAMESADHWDDWDIHKVEMIHHYDEEKDEYPAWVRPKLSIMIVRYGLNQLGDFNWPVHYQGDCSDVQLEDSQFPPSEEWQKYAGEIDETMLLEESGEAWSP